MVAAWISAETGVGPSMASGNQVCKPNCADLPTTPKNRKNAIISIIFRLKPNKENCSSIKNGNNANTVKKSTVPRNRKIKNIPIASPQSPMRFTTIALKADLLACTLVNQKLINKYEDKPTPSQPKNICIKLPAVTRIAIKKVKNERYDMNLIKCGSSAIYSKE